MVTANLALGIDTGGTFTDGVIFDLVRKEVVAATKVITTRHDLALAVDRCIDDLLKMLQKEQAWTVQDRLKMVSLSTTLATNAIVESQGAEVGLIMIGFEPRSGLPTPFHSSIAGGCSIKGKFREELDLEAARAAVEEMKSLVDAFAVSGYLSVRNPAQELAVAGLIAEMTGYPVVCAHQLSSDLGFHERTVTAVLNARLMPLITDLVDAVKATMVSRGITAPLMVVKGDGSLISEAKAREKPIETILSGPAASIVGALTLTGAADGIVVDMGGTTTDVAVLKDGRPSLNDEGARVGGWLTRVKAARITTAGIGGDSFIQVDRNGTVSVGPQRVFPLSWIVSRYPYLLDELGQIEKAQGYHASTQPDIILCHIRDPLNISLTETEKQIMDLIAGKPHTLHHLAACLDKDVELLPWQRLVGTGSVHRASLTPTDILHLTGRLNIWNREAAALGSSMAAARCNCHVDRLAEAVLNQIYLNLAALITGRLIEEQDGESLQGCSILEARESRYFLKQMIIPPAAGEKLVEFSASVRIPLIAVGAPVAAYFPEIAGRLNAELCIPEYSEVANAVGTVSGKTVENVTILVKPGEGGGFLVHAPWGMEKFMTLQEAAACGREKGACYARSQAEAAGAADIDVSIEQHDRHSELSSQQGNGKLEHKLFIETVIEVSAVGRPWSD